MLLDMDLSGDLAKEILRQVKQRNSDVGVIVVAASVLTDDNRTTLGLRIPLSRCI